MHITNLVPNTRNNNPSAKLAGGLLFFGIWYKICVVSDKDFKVVKDYKDNTSNKKLKRL